MTIQKALDLADDLKPNMMSRKLKVDALSELDGLIHREIILKHEHPEEMETFSGYSEDTDPGTELIAPYPYDGMYKYWIMAVIDEQNLEMDKYENDRTKFNAGYDMFHDWWRRNHMPLTKVRELRI